MQTELLLISSKIIIEMLAYFLKDTMCVTDNV